MADELKEIPLENIFWPDPTDITEQQIKDMAASLETHGVIEPIVITPDENGKYRGVCGRLRYEGMKHLGRKTILARIHRFESELDIKMWQLAENLHRRQIPAMMRAKQLKDLYELLKKKNSKEATIQTLARTLEDMTSEKENMKTVQHYLSLTKLQPEVQEILTREKWPLRWGLELTRIKDSEKQVETAKRILKETKNKIFPIKSVEQVKDVVDEALRKEREQKRNEQLKKKAEQIEKETGKKVYVDRLLSWEERKKFHRWWYEEPPEECKKCEKTGILLEANFHQVLICLDPKCWEKKEEEQERQEQEKVRERERILREEQRKVWDVKEYDERHWRLAVCGLIKSWELRKLLDLKRGEWDPSGLDETLWKKIQDLNEDECKRLLIRHAVEEILTGPQTYWSGGDSPAKKWAVEEFSLKREVFLRSEEASKDA